MREFLERLRDGLKEADPSILGMKRERLKREWRNVQPALTASVALAQGITPAWERVVSERLYNDSKLLGSHSDSCSRDPCSGRPTMGGSAS
jgi:hypothetical protein